jgi:hypothetical protein
VGGLLACQGPTCNNQGMVIPHYTVGTLSIYRVLGILLVLGMLPTTQPGAAAQPRPVDPSENLYAVDERALTDSTTAGSNGFSPGHIALDGRLVAWSGRSGDPPQAVNLDTNQRYTFSLPHEGAEFWLQDGWISTLEREPTNLGGDADGQRTWYLEMEQLATGERTRRLLDRRPARMPEPRLQVWGRKVAFTREAEGAGTLVVVDLDTGAEQLISSNLREFHSLSLAGRYLAWPEPADPQVPFRNLHLMRADLGTGGVDRITTVGELSRFPQVSEAGHVAWGERTASGGQRLVAWSESEHTQQEMLQVPPREVSPNALSLSGTRVVWSQYHTVWGYDLAAHRRFVVSRAIGPKWTVLLSGDTVAWVDGRHDRLGRWIHWSDLYVATLRPGPAPIPPAYGAPPAAEARIGQVSVRGEGPEALADVFVTLVQPGTNQAVACQWDPSPRLWIAVDGEPAQAARGIKDSWGGPRWRFTVNTGPAFEPGRTASLFVGVDDTPTTSNVWVLGSAPGTASPSELARPSPEGIGAGTGATSGHLVEVQAHPDPTDPTLVRVQARAVLFDRGTRRTVPSHFERRVVLYGGRNLETLQPLATGVRVPESRGVVDYPSWEFRDVRMAAGFESEGGYHLVAAAEGEDWGGASVWHLGPDPRPLDPPSRLLAVQSC